VSLDNIQGWVFALPCKLGLHNYTGEDAQDLRKIQSDEDKAGVEFINQIFEIPRDYHIARLYAQLACK